MDRTSKTRVLTIYDVMTANKRARAAIEWLQNTGALSDAYAKQSIAGVEYMTQELLALLTEDEK